MVEARGDIEDVESSELATEGIRVPQHPAHLDLRWHPARRLLQQSLMNVEQAELYRDISLLEQTPFGPRLSGAERQHPDRLAVSPGMEGAQARDMAGRSDRQTSRQHPVGTAEWISRGSGGGYVAGAIEANGFMAATGMASGCSIGVPARSDRTTFGSL